MPTKAKFGSIAVIKMCRAKRRRLFNRPVVGDFERKHPTVKLVLVLL